MNSCDNNAKGIAAGGLDVLSNLITICFHEHNEVHQEKLWLEGDANGKVLATRIACPEGYLI